MRLTVPRVYRMAPSVCAPNESTTPIGVAVRRRSQRSVQCSWSGSICRVSRMTPSMRKKSMLSMVVCVPSHRHHTFAFVTLTLVCSVVCASDHLASLKTGAVYDVDPSGQWSVGQFRDHFGRTRRLTIRVLPQTTRHGRPQGDTPPQTNSIKTVQRRLPNSWSLSPPFLPASSSLPLPLRCGHGVISCRLASVQIQKSSPSGLTYIAELHEGLRSVGKMDHLVCFVPGLSLSSSFCPPSSFVRIVSSHPLRCVGAHRHVCAFRQHYVCFRSYEKRSVYVCHFLSALCAASRFRCSCGHWRIRMSMMTLVWCDAGAWRKS